MQDTADCLGDDPATENRLVVVLRIKQRSALKTDNRWGGRGPRLRIGLRIGLGTRLRIGLGTGKHCVDFRRTALTMRGEGAMRSRKLQHGCRNGIASLP